MRHSWLPTVMRPVLEYASSICSSVASSVCINKLQVMQNVALRAATGCTQDTNIQHLHDETLIVPIHAHLQLHASQYKQKTTLVSTTPACTWWNRPEEDLSSGILESTHPSWTVVKSMEVFMESRQLYAATLTHYSAEPLTTGPDYDPLLLRLALAGDAHPNPGPTWCPCSVCFKNVTSQDTSYLCTRCSHWVHSRCYGLRNAAVYHKANGWICTACMTPPQPRAHSPPPCPAHTPTMSDKSFNILEWNANGIGNKQTELSIFLEAHNIQESNLTAKSRSPNIQNYTLVRQDRRQGPGGGLLFFYS